MIEAARTTLYPDVESTISEHIYNIVRNIEHLRDGVQRLLALPEYANIHTGLI